MEIRKLTKKDLPIRVLWMNNPKVYKSMHFEIPVSLENTEKWFDRVVENSKRSDVAFIKDGEVVAMGGLTNIFENVRKAELYIFVNPISQSSGIGTEAIKLLCKYGFFELGLNKIFLETNEDNMPARKVYEKCGFKLEGVLRNEYITHKGEYKARLYYGLLKSEYDD